MTPFEAIRIWGLEKLGRYYSSYRAFVINPKPDNKNIGNILVHVPRVQGGMDVIARAKQYYGGPGFGAKYFQPNKGEIVWVEFENGNPTKPLWSYHTWAEDECPQELKGTNTAGFVTANGNKIYIVESEGSTTMKVLVQDGPEITITNNEVTITKGDTTITTDGSTVKLSGTNVEISGNLIKLNKGTNGGLLNMAAFQSLLVALQADLTLAGSGLNLTQWQLTNQATIEDGTVLH